MGINEKIHELIKDFNQININVELEIKSELSEDEGYNKKAFIHYNHQLEGKTTNLIIARQEWQTEYEFCETDIENLNSLYIQAKHYYGKMYSSSRYTENEIYQTKCRICNTIHDWEFHSIDDPDNLGFLGFVESHLLHPQLFVCKNCNYQTVQDIVSYNQYK